MGVLGYIRGYYYDRKKRKTHKHLKKLSQNKVSQWVQSGLSIRIEIGAGEPRNRPGWVTLDRNTSCDLYWDLIDGMPFPDSTVTAIYASHVLEHIPVAGLTALLRDCYRSLKPGGSISICVPNARLYIEAYLNGRRFMGKESPHCWLPGWHETGSLIDQVNYIAYMSEEHKFMFDEDSLPRILQQAGFERASLRNFDQELDLSGRDFESIYAIGFKPV
jgi:predicted SAM-dependent methyltransferase